MVSSSEKYNLYIVNFFILEQNNMQFQAYSQFLQTVIHL